MVLWITSWLQSRGKRVSPVWVILPNVGKISVENVWLIKQSSFRKAYTDKIPLAPPLLPPMLVAWTWGFCGRAKHMTILFALKPSCQCAAPVFLYVKHPLCIWRLGGRSLPICTWNLQLSASAPVGWGIWNIFVFPGHSRSSEIWPLESRGLLQACS